MAGQPETGYVFNGIGFVESQDRYNEHRTGVPAQGNLQTLMTAPAKASLAGRGYTSAVHVHNTGEEDAHLRLRHGETTKTRTAERLASFATGVGNRFTGTLQFKSLVAGSIVITEAGALADIVDDGNGNLVDIGTTTVRGTVDYVKGLLDWTYGGAATLPVTITYQHTDFEDFVSPAQVTTKTSAGGGSGGTSEIINTGFGRVNPGSVTITEGGVLTFSDDGKGNIIQTNVGFDVVGSIDYATGVIDIDQASGNLAGTITVNYTFNPFAVLLKSGAGAKLLDLFSQIPELAGQAWGLGTVTDNVLGLVGETRSTGATNLVTRWYHFSEDPYRVEEVYSGFPAGGHDNDPRL